MRQEKLIAIAFVVAALIFSTVTYSFAERVIVIQKLTPVSVQTVDISMYRVSPCNIGAVVVRPMMPRPRGYQPMYMSPICPRYMMMCPCTKAYPDVSRIRTHGSERAAMVPNLHNRTYGVKYHNLHGDYVAQ
ncbi:hypothetical protein [Halodesulfovibrio sp. MK-HDV]|jgi:hypothetical protein|uniref:hypothetical protein n=1 Tax=unclassified Halodesulfovibrio TaxID=2644657 RepID=UPI001370547D|nr:hypothetical protein [Halodesulfovibrio sp. MK-HDV]KAF1076712.1 hypothetical protein MKHDV_00841 [Halodesulfovibrio sp. MK-HDV]